MSERAIRPGEYRTMIGSPSERNVSMSFEAVGLKRPEEPLHGFFCAQFVGTREIRGACHGEVIIEWLENRYARPRTASAHNDKTRTYNSRLV